MIRKGKTGLLQSTPVTNKIQISNKKFAKQIKMSISDISDPTVISSYYSSLGSI